MCGEEGGQKIKYVGRIVALIVSLVWWERPRFIVSFMNTPSNGRLQVGLAKGVGEAYYKELVITLFLSLNVKYSSPYLFSKFTVLRLPCYGMDRETHCAKLCSNLF